MLQVVTATVEPPTIKLMVTYGPVLMPVIDRQLLYNNCNNTEVSLNGQRYVIATMNNYH